MNDDLQDRIVQQEHVGNYFISTVRLPYDMIETLGYSYETMIKLDDEWIDYQVRCDTIEEANAQHNNAKQWVIISAPRRFNSQNHGVLHERSSS